MAATTSPSRATLRLLELARVLLLLIVVLSALFTAIPAQGASVIWTGLGTTNNWNDGANWSTGIRPGSSDVAIFDATSTKDATINVAVNVAGIQVSVGYSGTITQSAFATTVGASGFSQSDGTILGSSSAITVNGGFTLSGGSFTSTSGTLSVAGSFTHGGGAFEANGGTVKFTGGGAVINVPGAETFHHLTFAPTTAGAVKTVTAGTNLIVQGTLTLTEGAIDTGSVLVQGDVSQASTFDGGSGLLLLVGAGDQVFSGAATSTAGSLPNVEIVKPSGLLSLVGTIRTTRNWTYSSGVVDPGVSTVVFAGTLTVGGSQVFAAVVIRGAVTVPGGSDQVWGSLTMPSAVALTVNGSVVVSGAAVLTDGSIAGTGSVLVQGDVSQASTFDGGSGLLLLVGAGDQVFSGAATSTAGSLPNVEIVKPSGLLSLVGTIRTTRNWTYSSGVVDPGVSTVVFAGTLTVGGSQVFAAVVIRGAVTVPGGSDQVWGSLTMPSAVALTVNGSVVVSGAAVLTDGSIAGTGSVLVQGDVSQASTFDGGSGLLLLVGAGDQVFSGAATSTAGSLPNVEIVKPSGLLSLVGTIRTTRNWTYSSGVVDPGVSTVVFAGTLTVGGSQVFAAVVIRGAVTVPGGSDQVWGSLTMPSAVALTVNGSVVVSGAAVLTDGSIAGTGSVLVQGDVSQASTFDGGSGLLLLVGAGDQVFSGAATSTAGSLPNVEIVKPSGLLSLVGTIRTTRNWTYSSGVVDPGVSTVVFAGTLTVGGSQVFAAVVIRGAVTVPGGSDQVWGSLTMPSAVALTVNGSVVVSGAAVLTDGSIAGTGSVLVQGDVSQASTFDGGSGLLLLVGAGDQVFSGAATSTAGSLPNVEIVKPSGLLSLVGTIRTTRNWTYSSGVVDPGVSTVVFAGTEQVSVAGMTFSSVTVAGGALSSGVTLVQGPLIVTGTLTLASGRITTGGSKVVVASTGNVARTNGHVFGDMQKHVPTGSALSITFEIGDATRYTPVVVSFGNVTVNGDLIASTDAGDHADIANSGVSPMNSVNRWWTLTNSTIGFDYYDIAINFVGADVDPSSDTSAFIVSKLDGVTWMQPAVLARTATSIKAGGLTTFSEFVVGEPVADVGVSITGSPEPALLSGTITYLVTVENAGPALASNVVLTDPLPAGVAYQSADSSQGSCTEASATVTCALGDLPTSATATVAIRVTASTTGTFTNTVTVTITETDPDTANNTASWISHIQYPTDPPSAGTVPPPGTFVDVPVNFWAYPYIEALFKAGLTQGCATTDGTRLYCPNIPVTRAEMAAFLSRGLDLPAAPPTGFSDVPNDAWYADAVSRLAAAGITKGCAPGLFCPNNVVTRAEMAVFLSRGLNLPAAPPTGFSDVPNDAWYADAVSRLAAAGITKGCAPSLFCSDSPVTRAEMAAFLTRALNIAPS